MKAANFSEIHYEFCPMDTTLKILSGHWKSIILCRLLEEKELHFNELSCRIPNCSRWLLALQLKELVRAKIITRQVADQKIFYELSDNGKSLIPIVLALNNWGKNCLSITEGIF